MYLKSIELTGFKSFGKKTQLVFTSAIASIVGPNGSGKSNIADGFRFVLGEQSMKSMRGKKGEDMIWGGTPALPRQNRATVKLVFDNSKRPLDIDFSEVIVERVVYRDGQNEYLLNGSQVRLKDVIRLLAGANIGGSGYQIISQGEADRILNASPRERREMVEDALGLKLYQHKKAESERKLVESAVNIDKTKSLRRELSPHLTFLRNQVEKIEKAREMKDEGGFLDDARAHDADMKALTAQLHEAAKKKGEKAGEQVEGMQRHVRELQGKLSDVRRRREEVARELGRAEGALEATNVTVESIVPVPHVRQFVREIDATLSDAERQEDIHGVRRTLSDIRGRIKAFVDGLSGTAPETNEEVRRDVERLSSTLKQVESDEAKFATDLDMARAGIGEMKEASFAAERQSVELESKIREIRTKLEGANAARGQLRSLRERFDEEVREGVALVGPALRGWDSGAIPDGALSENRSEQEKRRRGVERLKIKIEEAGVGNGEQIVKEFSQTKERDEFLARELADLEKSAESLKDIIAELEKTIDLRFTEGLKHINAALKEFFAKLFGGGEARLDVEKPRRKSKADDLDEDMEDFIPEEEEELSAGLTVSVHLPRKKVHGLEVLSGGERALTSIALIFSMSQVNPPPFLVLDETDAALDEANSKRYADMIVELGKHSQLIVITHNRATMAAAGELYGVTMSNDGVSKILSVKLEEAERVAK